MKKDKKEKTKEVKLKGKEINLPEDFIGRMPFVSQVYELINVANENKSWTFAIDGAWGSGKSYVLSMLKNEMERNDSCFIVKYDAWENDFYSDPLIAIICVLLDKIESIEIWQGVRYALGIICEVFRLLPDWGKYEKSFSAVFSKFKNYDKKSNKIKLAEGFKSYKSAIETLKTELQKITQNRKLIILVDELDRCEPEYALTVLNRLHNVFDISNTVIIVAVNKEQLKQVIESKYGTKSGNKYLEKFFDLTFSLPEKGEDDIREQYAKQIIDEYISDDVETLKDYASCQLFIGIIKTYLTFNPREVVKFFERLRFIVKDFDDSIKKYDILCIASYLLLINNDTINFLKNFVNGLDARSVIDLFKNHMNQFLHSPLLDYIEENKINPDLRHTIYCTYEDKEIRRLFAMLVIYMHLGNSGNITTFVNQLFGTNFTDLDFIDIQDVVKMITIIKRS